MRPFTSIPFLRIILPYVTGILLAFAAAPKIPFWILPALVLLLLLAMFRNNKIHKLRILLLADLFLLCLGLCMTRLAAEHPGLRYFECGRIKQDYLVCISDVPVPKTRSLKCEVEVLGLFQDGHFEKCSGKALLYIKNSKLNSRLQAGTCLQVHTSFSLPGPPGNPGEFDYAAYLAAHHVRGTAYCDSGSIVLRHDVNTGNSVKQAGLRLKAWIIGRLRNSELQQSAYAICCALLTGYDDEIEKGTMNAFAHSGTLHVLSVSGLHTGLIYAALAFLWGLADRQKKYRFTEFTVVTAVLWLFALMTGFSAPVLRAVIMFNLMGFGRIFFRQNYRNQMNVLLVSAFMLLLYDPWLLKDAGFLLSYFAMFGLFYFQPAINKLWQPESRAGRIIWPGVTSSVAATISTLPITLYLFRQFPIWFIVCNLVVVPCTFILLMLALLVVLHVPGTVLLTNWLTDFLYGFILLFDRRNSGYLEGLDFRFGDVILLSLLILLLSLAFEFRSKRFFIAAWVLLIVWQCQGLVQSFATKKEEYFTAYAVRKSEMISVKCQQSLIYTCRDSSLADFTLKPHLAQMNYPQSRAADFNCIVGQSNTILLLDSFVPRLRDKNRVTVLLLRNGFHGRLPDISPYRNLRVIVTEGGLGKSIREATADLCRNFGIRFHPLPEQGAFIVNL